MENIKDMAMYDDITVLMDDKKAVTIKTSEDFEDLRPILSSIIKMLAKREEDKEWMKNI